MANNRHLAELRTLSLKRKFQSNSDFHREYRAFMETILSSGHAELVPQDQLTQENRKVWYIPHHIVFHPKKGACAWYLTTLQDIREPHWILSCFKVRTLQTLWSFRLLHFRQGKIAIMADVEKMYHQVKVSPRHVKWLWLSVAIRRQTPPSSPQLNIEPSRLWISSLSSCFPAFLTIIPVQHLEKLTCWQFLEHWTH